MENKIEMSTDSIKIVIEFSNKPNDNDLNIISAIMKATMSENELYEFVNKVQAKLS